ncbi:MAG: hypothetical protein AB1921_01085 [Thermodesulfobacteriota bacterium]
MEEPDEAQLKKTLDSIVHRVDRVVQRLKEKGYIDAGREKDSDREENGPAAVTR